MLLALRAIVDADLPIPIRIGVHRGAVFAGDIGPVLPAHVHGDGRRREPRRAPDGEGGAGTHLCDGRRARPLEHAVRDHRARAVHGQGQGAAGRGMGRAGHRVAHAAVALQPLPLTGRDAELATSARGARRPRGRARAAVRDRRRSRHRQDAAARGAARRRDGLPQAARGLRGLYRVDAVCRVAGAPAGALASAATNPTTRWRRASAKSSPALAPDSCRGCRCSPSPSTSKSRRRRKSRCSPRRTGARSCTRAVVEFLEADAARHGADRDRERAPHGRRVGRAPRLPRASRRRAAVAHRVGATAGGAADPRSPPPRSRGSSSRRLPRPMRCAA